VARAAAVAACHLFLFFRISEMEAEKGREGERGSAFSPFVK
jgi:hypothetical protein